MKRLKPLMLTKDPLNGYRSNEFGDHEWESWQIEKFELVRPLLSDGEWESFCKNLNPDFVRYELSTRDEAYQVIVAAFSWGGASEGNRFWQDIARRLRGSGIDFP